jgi:Domain of unknown function (DUF4282)
MPDDPPDAQQSLASSAWSLVKAVSDLVLDFSFKKFVTPKLVRIIYALSLVAALLSALTWMFSGFKDGITHGLFTLVTGPLAFFFYVLCARVAMELVLAVFSIEAEVKKLNEKGR